MVQILPLPASSQAFEELVAFAGRKTAPIPAPAIASLVLRVTEGGDWPVQRAALEAVLRRVAMAKSDELRVELSGRRSILGAYQTRAPSRGVRPYQTELTSIDPVQGSCGCPDFLRASLGVCKHLLAILLRIHAEPEAVRQAVGEQARGQKSARIPVLSWDPVRPLMGRGDFLERLAIGGDTAIPTLVRRRLLVAEGGVLRPRPESLAMPERRRALVGQLLEACEERSLKATPAAKAICLLEASRLEPDRASPALLDQRKAALRGFGRTLYPYQLEGVRAFLTRGRLLLADDMGLGKTTQAIAACHLLARAGKVRRGLMVVPASLRWQWLREWRACTDVPAELAEGSPEERRRGYRNLKAGFLIVGYEQLVRDFAAIRKMQPELVVLDEAQRIKNWHTKTARTVKLLDVPFRLVLTGTPFENRLAELASILDWVDDLAIEPKWRLEPWHISVVGDADRGKRGARHLDTLRARLDGVLVRRVRQEVLSQLPPRTDTVVPVPMTEAQRSAHGELDLPIARLIATSKRRPLTQPEFLRLMTLLATQRIISNGLGLQTFEETWPAIKDHRRPTPALLDSLFSPKLQELRELVEQVAVGQGRKMVIFSQWRRMLQLSRWAIGDLLDDAGLRAVFFTGAESPRSREQSLIELHDDPRTRIMFLTDAGGVGLNLQRAATCCVNLELPWNPAVLEQRIARIHRLGQKEPIDVYNLRTEEGIEQRIFELLGSKRALFQGLFDGQADEVRFERAGGFLAEVQRILPPIEEPGGAEPEDLAEEESGVGELSPAPQVSGVSPGEEAPAPADLPGLLAGVRIARETDGTMVLRAEPAAAKVLSGAFELLAQLLRGPAAS